MQTYNFIHLFEGENHTFTVQRSSFLEAVKAFDSFYPNAKHFYYVRGQLGAA